MKKVYIHGHKPYYEFKLNKTVGFLGMSIVFYAVSILIVLFDKNFEYRFVSFFLHILSLILVSAFFLKESLKKSFFRKIKEKDILLVGIVLAVIELISFSYLLEYPFVSLGDEVRDGGLNAMQIYDGTIKNIFAYGRYDAHGLIIPTISSLFYVFFGGTVYAYRFSSALISVFEIIIFFIFARISLSRTAAFFSAMILSTMPLHIFFSRTQIVVAFNSFWTSILMLMVYVLFKKQRTIDFALLGLLIGFVFGFHAGVRVVSVLVMLLVFVDRAYYLFKNFSNKEEVNRVILKIIVLTVFVFVGFGPRLLFSNAVNFFHTSRLDAFNNEKRVDFVGEAVEVKEKYVKSVMAWIYEPAGYMYPDKKPILTPFLSVFFLIGIGYCIFVKKERYINIFLVLVIFIPLINSAITESLNADHRLSVLMPLGSFFVGAGIYYVYTGLRRKIFRYTLGFIVIFYLLYQAGGFFINQPANKGYEIKDYLSMHMVYLLKNQDMFEEKNVCIYVSNKNLVSYKLAHYQEKYQYFLKNYNLSFVSSENISDNKIFLGKNCNMNIKTIKNKKTVYCSQNSKKYFCPLDYTGKMEIYY